MSSVRRSSRLNAVIASESESDSDDGRSVEGGESTGSPRGNPDPTRSVAPGAKRRKREVEAVAIDARVESIIEDWKLKMVIPGALEAELNLAISYIDGNFGEAEQRAWAARILLDSMNLPPEHPIYMLITELVYRVNFTNAVYAKEAGEIALMGKYASEALDNARSLYHAGYKREMTREHYYLCEIFLFNARIASGEMTEEGKVYESLRILQLFPEKLLSILGVSTYLLALANSNKEPDTLRAAVIYAELAHLRIGELDDEKKKLVYRILIDGYLKLDLFTISNSQEEINRGNVIRESVMAFEDGDARPKLAEACYIRHINPAKAKAIVNALRSKSDLAERLQANYPNAFALIDAEDVSGEATAAID